METVYSSKLSPVLPGQVITISGRSKPDAGRFEIDLSEGSDETFSQEIPLQISVRFCEFNNEIVRNSHTEATGWGDEERMENVFPGNQPNPIQPGDEFKISILIDEEFFFLTINDKPYCTFAHRTDFSRITRLNILNDVERIFRVDHETVKSDKWPVKSDDVFRASIPRFFNIGDIFVIKGVTSGSDCGSFALNLLDENLKRAFFHMRCNLDTQCVKVNSQNRDHYWINRENQVELSAYPFKIDEPFKIAIVVKESEFQLVINGEPCCFQPYEEDLMEMFKTMNGIEIISRDGTKVNVKSFEHFSMEDGYDENEFEGWAADIIY